MVIPEQVDFRVGKVLQAIEHNPSVTIPYLARLVNLSSSRLSHVFKAQTGLSLKSFLTEQRLGRAALLLRTTEMRIKKLTYLTGYSQEPNFVRAFHKKFRCSPTHYRNQQQQPILLRNSPFR